MTAGCTSLMNPGRPSLAGQPAQFLPRLLPADGRRPGCPLTWPGTGRFRTAAVPGR